MKKSRRERYIVRDDMVRVTGLEPARITPLDPKSSVFANFTIPANNLLSIVLGADAANSAKGVNCFVIISKQISNFNRQILLIVIK